MGNPQYAADAKMAQPMREDGVTRSINRLYDKLTGLEEANKLLLTILIALDGPPVPTPTTPTNPAGAQQAPSRPPTIVGSLNYLDRRMEEVADDIFTNLSRIDAALAHG